MRSSFTLLAAAALLSAACADSPTTPATSLRSIATEAQTAATVHYQVIDLTTDLVAAGFDGQFSTAFELTNNGSVRGAATVGGFQHGFVWANGKAIDLGALGGPQANSQAGGRSDAVVSILSEISTADPLAEDFCGFHSPLTCRAAMWSGGTMTALSTLGGNNAAALAGNVAGQLVGLAEDGVLDSGCIPPQKSHFQAAIWDHGQVRELPPLPGDQVGMAVRINDLGQAVGTSGLCSNTLFGGVGFGPHAVMWDNGTPIYLGDLGDHTTGFAAGINNHGVVVGGASTPDGSMHAFRWTAGTGMQDLGLLSLSPADAVNAPTEINERGEFVGSSCDVTFATCRGYVWQDGTFQDLNSLTTGPTNLYIVFPCGVNDVGQIAGLAVDVTTGAPHVFLAEPVYGAAPLAAAIAATLRPGRAVALPAAFRSLLAARLGRRAR